MAHAVEEDSVVMLRFPDSGAIETASSQSSRSTGSSVFLQHVMRNSLFKKCFIRVVNAIDGRFSCIEDELKFIQARQDNDLVISLLLAALLFLVAMLTHVGPLYLQEASRANEPFQWEPADQRTWYFMGVVIAVLVSVVIAAVTGLRAVCLAFRRWPWEIIALGCLMFCTGFICYGFALEMDNDVWAHNSPKTVVLNAALLVDAIITASCLYIPIRTYRLWVFMVWTLLLFIAGLLVANSNGLHLSFQELFLPPFVLACLCFMSFIGALRHERHVRQDWLSARQVLESLDDLQAKDKELKGAAALGWCMHLVAESLCDMVIKLAEDLVVCDTGLGRQAFFGSQVEGKPFTGLLGENDRERFRRLLARVHETRLPQCLPVTLLREGLGCAEVQLLVVDTGLSRPRYCVGIQVEKEEEIPSNVPETAVYGNDLDTATASNIQLVVGCIEEFPENVKAPRSILGYASNSRPAGAGSNRRGDSEISFELSRTTDNTGMAAARCLQLPSENVERGTQTPNPDYAACFVQTEVSLPAQPGLKSPWRQRSRREAPPRVPSCTQTLDGQPVPVPQETATRRSRSASRARDRSKEFSTRCLLLSTAKPIIPRFKETPENVIAFCLLKALHFMNVRGVGCCNWHVGAEVLRRAANRMASQRCNKKFAPFDTWQCVHCLALNDDQSEADEDGEPWCCGICEQPREPDCRASGEDEQDSAGVESDLDALDLF